MKHQINTILLLLSLSAFGHTIGQIAPPTYVIVHGAWGGSWAFK